MDHRDRVVPRHRDVQRPAVGRERQRIGIAPERRVGIEGDRELLDHRAACEIDARDAVGARQGDEQLTPAQRQGGRMRADDEGGPADRGGDRHVDHAHGRIAPIAHVEMARVRDHGVGRVAHGHRAAPSQRGGVDQVHRVAQVPDHRHQAP